MKKYIALIVCFIASLAHGQIVTYQIQGKIIALNAPDFITGGSYTLDFSLAQSGMVAPDVGNVANYGLVALSLKFNYGKGTYVGTLDSATATAWNFPVENGGDLFMIGGPFGENINFPAEQGNPLLSTDPRNMDFDFDILQLSDPTATALSSGEPIDLTQFGSSTIGNNRLGLIWGTDDPDHPWSAVVGSVDSIEKISPNLAPVPEPSTYGLMGSMALFGLVARQIKRKRQAQTA